jgi:hypothetical protein
MEPVTRRRGARDRKEAPRPSPRLLPIIQKKRLDLSRPADEPLSPEEQKEMVQHLSFLRRFKGVLRLSLNAQEDLLVNGAKPPEDRGLCKHLLAKVDRTMIDRALSRDPMSSDPVQRASFLAGIVRLDPDPDLLLRYLEALSQIAERREAAQAFSLTVDRLDFAKVSPKQTEQILSVIARTFEGHDRTRALFGLLENETFRGVLAKVLGGLDRELAEIFRPLAAAYDVLLGHAPADDEDDRVWSKGVTLLLQAPEGVLKSYPETVRAKIAELSIRGEIEDAAAKEATRRLISTLPARDPVYSGLRRARAEQLLAARDLEAARSLLNQLASVPDDAAWAKPRRAALEGKRLGPVTVGEKIDRESSFHEAFWLDKTSFVLARIGPPSEAAKLSTEAKLHAELTVPGVAPVLQHGIGDEGTYFILIPRLGSPYRGVKKEASLLERLTLALEGVRLLASIAQSGVVVPDLAPSRFLWSPIGLFLADLSGARAEDPARAAMSVGGAAIRWCGGALEGSDRSAIPAALRKMLRGSSASLRLLMKELAEAIARGS